MCAALAVLPWLHSRFAVLAASSALVIVWRVIGDSEGRSKRLAALSLFPVASAAAWFWFFQIIYGTSNPSVVYGGDTSTALGNLIRGAPGLLFDQQFGVIPNAPVFLCALAGLAVMLWRGPRRLAIELLIIAIPYYLIVGLFFMWWGGRTAPSRFLVPVLLLLVVSTAVWFNRATSAAARAAGFGALVVSFLATATMATVDRGGFVFNFRDGMSRVALWLSPVVDLTTALPSLFQNPSRVVLVQTAVWLAAIAAAVAVTAFFSRRGHATVMLVGGLAFEVAAMVAVSSVWRSNDAVVATPYPAGPALLRRYDPEARQIALAFRPFHRIEPTDLLRRIVLARTLSTTHRAESVTMAHLHAGVYAVSGKTIGAASGRVRLKTDRVSGPIAEWDAASLESNWTRHVTLPVALVSLQFETDVAARSAIRDVSIRAVSVSAPEEGLGNREARRGARYGPATVFLLGGNAWVEPAGIWVAGASAAEFIIVPDPSSAFQLFVRNGPVENIVTLESGSWRKTLALTPSEERLVPVPANPRRRTTPLHVDAANGFRPADVVPQSQDLRFLGVWIETR